MIRQIVSTIGVVAVCGVLTTAQADNSEIKSTRLIEETVVIGDREDARRVAGSGAVLNQLQLDLSCLLYTSPSPRD